MDTNPMSAAELNQRAREVWDNIADDAGSRTAHTHRIARLYGVARDIQHACEAGAGEMSVYRIIAFLASVFTRSYLPKLGFAP
jgi:hypothetical protein